MKSLVPRSLPPKLRSAGVRASFRADLHFPVELQKRPVGDIGVSLSSARSLVLSRLQCN